MKKLIILLAVCLTITLTACSATDTTDTGLSGIISTDVTSEPTGGSAETSEPAETANTASGDNATPDPIGSTPAATTSPAGTPAGSDNSKPTNPPVTTSKPPATTNPPATTPPPAPFNPQPYIDYAIWYGESIGLIHEPRIGTGSWDSPLNLYASLTDAIMKSNIEGRCERIKREGNTHFYVEAKPLADGSYQLYLYCA